MTMSQPAAETTAGATPTGKSRLHGLAEQYAGRGIPVFPIDETGDAKRPATKHGLLDATTDLEKIANWWGAHPARNIGIPTGAPAGFWVLDVDGPEGAASLAALEAEHGALPETPEQTTARGRHICFKHDADRPMRNSTSRHPRHGFDPRAKIDVRGDGGYIVAAPSKHATGFTYAWHVERKPSKVPFAVAPEWLREILEWKASKAAAPELTVVPAMPAAAPRGKRGSKLITPYGEAALRDECAKIETSVPGTQETTLNTCAFTIGTLVGGGEITESIARSALVDSGMKIARDWSLEDVCQKVERALSAGIAKPRAASELPPSRQGYEPRPLVSEGTIEGEALPSNTPITEAQARNVIERRPAPVPLGPGEMPTIEIRGGGLSEEATLGEQAIIAAGLALYQRGDALVRPVVEEVAAAHGRRTHIARLLPVDQHLITDCLCRSARFEKFDGRSERMKRINPPAELARVILSRQGEWTFPRIVGVITTPTLRPDGSLLIQAGYDHATRLLLVEPPCLPPIAEKPSRGDAVLSLYRLRGLLGEFPCAGAPSRSVALSALITPVVRAAFTVSPMHVARASTPGSGKSFLLDVAAAIAIGRPMPVMAAGRTEEETEKRLGAALLSGQPLISIDNVNGDLGGDALSQIVERPVVDIRVLGKSERVSIEARSTLFATGNNIRLVGDMTRRVIVCTLDANMERPEGRSFAGNPVKAVLADRGRYVADALIICRAYIVAGHPAPAPPLGSFEGWSNLVRSALIWLGEADPVETMAAAREEDPFLQAMRAVYGAINAAVGPSHPLSSADLIKLASEKVSRSTGEGEYHDAVEHDWRLPDLREALLSVAGKNGFIDGRALGNWFGRHKGRIANGLRLDGITNERTARWWLNPAVTAV
jgi:hypothetical protein